MRHKALLRGATAGGITGTGRSRRRLVGARVVARSSFQRSRKHGTQSTASSTAGSSQPQRTRMHQRRAKVGPRLPPL